MPRVLIDANIFLELELGQSKSGDCKRLLSSVAKGEIKAVTTDFIVDSIAVVMQDRKCSAADIRKFFSSLILYRGMIIYSLGIRGRIMATNEMERSGLDFDDATSLATMKSLNLKEIVSFDKDFDNVEGISRLEPRDLTVDI